MLRQLLDLFPLKQNAFPPKLMDLVIIPQSAFFKGPHLSCTHLLLLDMNPLLPWCVWEQLTVNLITIRRVGPHHSAKADTLGVTVRALEGGLPVLLYLTPLAVHYPQTVSATHRVSGHIKPPCHMPLQWISQQLIQNRSTLFFLGIKLQAFGTTAIYDHINSHHREQGQFTDVISWKKICQHRNSDVRCYNSPKTRCGSYGSTRPLFTHLLKKKDQIASSSISWNFWHLLKCHKQKESDRYQTHLHKFCCNAKSTHLQTQQHCWR